MRCLEKRGIHRGAEHGVVIRLRRGRIEMEISALFRVVQLYAGT